jgi:hypothetical protein
MSASVLQPTAGTLKLGGTEFICQVVVGLVTVDQAQSRVEAMCETVLTFGQPLYLLDVDFLQDWHTSGISWYLWNHGDPPQTVTFEFSPGVDSTPKMAGSVQVCLPRAFGGTAKEPARDRIQMPCTARPTLTADS